MVKGSIFISNFLWKPKKTLHVLSFGEYPLSLHTSAHAMLSKKSDGSGDFLTSHV